MKINSVTSRKACVMHLSMQYPMRLCRWAGFFPVDALNGISIDKLRYNLCSPYSIYFIATMTGQIALTGFSLFQLITRQLTLATFSSFVFYGTALVASLLFLNFAKSYTDFLKTSQSLEHNLSDGNTRKKTYKSTALAFTVIGLAIVENILSCVFVMNLVMDCVGDFSFSAIVFENYFKFRMPYIYDHISYTTWKATLLEIGNLQATFLWSFTDVFIMGFSIYLSSYCNDLNDIINSYVSKGITLSFVIFFSVTKRTACWETVRIQHCHLIALVKLVNTKLSYFVLLAFFIDVFFICLQLFNTLNQGYSGFHSCGQKGLDEALNGLAHSVYYTFSFLFLFLRAMIMSLLAANVHAAARKPIFAMRKVTSTMYNVEVRRIVYQITYTKLGLGGIFFYITRKMILKVAAAIVTYELVLLQFGGGHGKHSSKGEDSTNISSASN